MLVLICGDRNWNNFKLIDQILNYLPSGTKIIEGDCRGADKISGYLARQHGFEVEPIPAEWNKYGDSAGPRRNLKMIRRNPDLIIAFHNNIECSKGTKHMIDLVIERNIPYLIVKE